MENVRNSVQFYSKYLFHGNRLQQSKKSIHFPLRRELRDASVAWKIETRARRIHDVANTIRNCNRHWLTSVENCIINKIVSICDQFITFSRHEMLSGFMSVKFSHFLSLSLLRCFARFVQLNNSFSFCSSLSLLRSFSTLPLVFSPVRLSLSLSHWYTNHCGEANLRRPYKITIEK